VRAEGAGTLAAPAAGPAGAPAAVAPARLVVCSDALEDRNGVDAYYRDLVAHLEGRVAHAELLCPSSGGLGRGRPDRLSIPMPGDAKQRICFPNPASLYRRVKAARPHTVLIATPGPFGLCGLYAARRLGARLIVGFHTDLEQLAGLYWQRALGRLGRRYLEMLNSHLLRRAELTVVNAASMCAPARNLGASRVAVMGTPVAQPFIETPLAPLAPSVRRVLYAGRLAPEKNLEAVLEAAERLPHLQFTVAGDGPLAGLVRGRAETLPNLRYRGWTPRARIVRLMDEADLLVLPSHVEAFGTVALEAMARRRPVLVSAGCGITGWPELADGIAQVGRGEPLHEAIARIAAAPADAREARALAGWRAARAVHRAALAGWLEVLSPGWGPPGG